MFRCEQHALDNLAAHRRRRGEVVYGAAGQIDIVEAGKGQGRVGVGQTLPPGDGVEYLYHPFHEDEGDESPAQKIKIVP